LIQENAGEAIQTGCIYNKWLFRYCESFNYIPANSKHPAAEREIINK
jgi:hypothetical protein